MFSFAFFINTAHCYIITTTPWLADRQPVG